MNDNLIYDVGMNNGDDTAYYLHLGFNVIAIEADPTLASQASERFKAELEKGKLNIINMGIASEPGDLEFWICETNSAWNSFDRTKASRHSSPHYKIRIPCQTFGWILRNYGIPYYLKVDIEGKDDLCVDALTKESLPKYVSVEADEDVSVLKKLSALGYNGFKLISQYNFLPLERPPNAQTYEYELYYKRWHPLLMSDNLLARLICKILGRERLWNGINQVRQYNDWTFPRGSSGPFGEHTPGQWISLEEIIDTYNYYLQLFHKKTRSPFWTSGDYAFWADFHARREN